MPRISCDRAPELPSGGTESPRSVRSVEHIADRTAAETVVNDRVRKSCALICTPPHGSEESNRHQYGKHELYEFTEGRAGVGQ